ncbi:MULTISPECIES: hypothetical protein [unclassified Streptomyces]|uniref:hypothetical protein n=1 Tax=unclassified Streptomyces TaxID=2593676 RepID=UPI002E370C39|nr:hypothetical protein [Streptomyces sp. NBC_01431]
MDSTEISHPPIYQRLVRERGDVVAETRTVAEQAQHEARQALDWSGVRRAQSEREGRSFSAFG